MSEENVTPEEVEALTGTAPAPTHVGVRPRDFHQPKRLSAEQLDELRVRVSVALGSIPKKLRPWLRSDVKIALQTVSEVNFRKLASAAGDPLCAASFRARGELGWAVWDSSTATGIAERALGVSAEEAPEGRRLSPVECSIIANLISLIANQLVAPLGFEATDFEMLQSVADLELSTEGQRGGDPQRLHLALAFEGPHGESTIRLYVPGVSAANAAGRRPAPPTPVPAHLSDIPVELCATLDTVEIALTDLLAIEVGDVIPLTARVEAPLKITIEDHPCAEARMGRKDGQLAIRLESLDLTPLDSPGDSHE